MVKSQTRSLIIFGAILFLFGLLTGGAIPLAENPRLALSSHLSGVQHGLVLMVFGLIWKYVSVSSGQMKLAYFLSIYSMYCVWMALLLGAFWGTGTSTPIAAPGYVAAAWQENVVNFFLYTGPVAIIIATIIIIIGLIKTEEHNY